MNNLINVQNNNGKLVVSSREIAKNFGKRHKHVLNAVSDLYVGVAEKSSDLFILSQYQHDQNKQWYKEYLLTRDGFSLLVMGFNGQKALQWKLKYIEAFNQMEQQLSQMPMLSEELQAIFALDKRSQRVEYRVKHLEDNMTVDYEQQEDLRVLAKDKAINALGEMGSPAYQDDSLRRKVFAAVWRDYKAYFKVNSYKNTARMNFNKAIDFLSKWQPSGKLLREIEDLNNQIQMV